VRRRFKPQRKRRPLDDGLDALWPRVATEEEAGAAIQRRRG
jgi:hypothetical protein